MCSTSPVLIRMSTTAGAHDIGHARPAGLDASGEFGLATWVKSAHAMQGQQGARRMRLTACMSPHDPTQRVRVAHVAHVAHVAQVARVAGMPPHHIHPSILHAAAPSTASDKRSCELCGRDKCRRGGSEPPLRLALFESLRKMHARKRVRCMHQLLLTRLSSVLLCSRGDARRSIPDACLRNTSLTSLRSRFSYLQQGEEE